MSLMVKSSISASCAAASRCRTVLVEPPMAISSVMAFSNAALLAMLRGSAAGVLLLVVAFGQLSDALARVKEQLLRSAWVASSSEPLPG